jgi:methylated-DNA-[protein]-cysteine S-methyltransferase
MSIPGRVCYSAVIATPVGPVGLLTEPGGLAAVDFLPPRTPGVAARDRLAEWAVRELLDYFTDPFRPFQIPIAPHGTRFQKAVWDALRAIPPGQTRTYGALASGIGTGPRAVGGACRANPLPILIPCHRVLAGTGLGGYGGASLGAGLEVKRWLLTHEGAVPREETVPPPAADVHTGAHRPR